MGTGTGQGQCKQWEDGYGSKVFLFLPVPGQSDIQIIIWVFLVQVVVCIWLIEDAAGGLPGPRAQQSLLSEEGEGENGGW